HCFPEITPGAPGRSRPGILPFMEYLQLSPQPDTASNDPIESFLDREYSAGFVTDIESVTIPKGLNEDTIRLLSAKKGEPEFMLQWRLDAYRHWLTMTPPEWAQVDFPAIDFQDISYYSAPKSKEDAPKSLDEVDPEL